MESRTEATTVSSQPELPVATKSQLFPRIVSGSAGSIVTSLVVTPLEVVKVRLQASTETATTAATQVAIPPRNNVAPCPRGCGTFVVLENSRPRGAVCHVEAAKSGKLTPQAKPVFCAGKAMSSCSSSSSSVGTFAMIRRIFVKEGFVGIYAGLRPTLVMAVPNTVLYFSAYDEIVWHLRNLSSDPYSQAWIPFLAGGSARFVASTCTSPFEYLRTRQALVTGRNEAAPGLVEQFRSIIQKEGGVGTLYRGLRPTLWRDVPFSSIYWLVLEHMKQQWASCQPFSQRPMTPFEQAGSAFVNGAVAGMVAAACTTPFDVVKTRQQALMAQPQHTVSAESLVGPTSRACSHNGATVYEMPLPRHGMGTFEHMSHIAKHEGVSGLWRGNQARMLKVAPACAIMISSYEYGKRILG